MSKAEAQQPTTEEKPLVAWNGEIIPRHYTGNDFDEKAFREWGEKFVAARTDELMRRPGGALAQLIQLSMKKPKDCAPQGEPIIMVPTLRRCIEEFSAVAPKASDTKAVLGELSDRDNIDRLFAEAEASASKAKLKRDEENDPRLSRMEDAIDRMSVRQEEIGADLIAKAAKAARWRSSIAAVLVTAPIAVGVNSIYDHTKSFIDQTIEFFSKENRCASFAMDARERVSSGKQSGA